MDMITWLLAKAKKVMDYWDLGNLDLLRALRSFTLFWTLFILHENTQTCTQD
jgi:hypothetical protein